LAGPLLKQPNRVAVAIWQIRQLRFLHGGGDSNLRRLLGKSTPDSDKHDRSRSLRLLG
jgi:hypothetical protein